MAVRACFGLARPIELGDDTLVLPPGRLALGILEAPGFPPLLLGSGYLHHGQEWSPGNVAILQAFGAAQSVLAMPFVFGADFQMSPEAVGQNQFVQKIDADIFAPANAP